MSLSTPVLLVEDVAATLLTSKGRSATEWGGATFLLGAGCSHSAGIPLAETIAREQVIELAKKHGHPNVDLSAADAALEWLQLNGKILPQLPWSQVYGELFRRHYRSATAQRQIISAAVDRSTGINWAHACLGELVHSRFVNTVLTTNFDLLALDGMVRSDLLPVIADGIEALNRVDGRPAYPQLVHVHGTRNSYHLRNTPEATSGYAKETVVVRALTDLLRSTPALVVVGYSGSEEGIMAAISDAAESLQPAPPIFWCLYSDKVSDLSDGARRLLALSDGGGVILGQDADGFFSTLMRLMRLEGPGWLVKPLQRLKERARRVARPRQPLLAALVDTYLLQIDELVERPTAPTEERLHQFRALSISGQSTSAVEMLRPDLVDLKSPSDLEALGDAAYESGRTRAASDHLRVAIDVYRRAAKEWTPDHDRSRVLNKLGNALQQFGSRQADSRLIDEAIDCYRAALKLREGGATRTAWAATQVNLGAALRQLNRFRPEPSLLRDALATYDAALTIYTPDMPLAWATALTNRSLVLFALGELEGDPTRFDAAITALEQCLIVLHPIAHRSQWLRATLNLANTVLKRAASEIDATGVERAVTQYRSGLEAFASGVMDELLAAGFHNGLAAALLQLGQRTGDKRAIGTAIDEFNASRLLRPRDRVPHAWATTQLNLAEARLVYAVGEESIEWLDAAYSASCEALDVFQRHLYSEDWARGQATRGAALLRLAMRGEGVAGLISARQCFDQALEVTPFERHALSWAGICHLKAEALTEIASRSGDPSSATEAMTTLGLVLDVRRRDRLPLDWACSLRIRARAAAVLFVLQSDMSLGEQAIVDADAVAQVLGPNVDPIEWCESLLVKGEVLLRRYRPSHGQSTQALDSVLDSLARVNLRDMAPLLWAHSHRLRGRREALNLASRPEVIRRVREHYERALEVYRRCRADHDGQVTKSLLAGL